MEYKVVELSEHINKDYKINELSIRKKMNIDPRLRTLLLFPKEMRGLKREMMLWRTVIIQAMRDALAGDKEAILWFTSPIFKSDLETVCELAGVNLKYILEIMLDVHDKKIKLPTWRKIRNIWRGEAEKDRAKRK